MLLNLECLKGDKNEVIVPGRPSFGNALLAQKFFSTRLKRLLLQKHYPKALKVRKV